LFISLRLYENCSFCLKSGTSLKIFSGGGERDVFFIFLEKVLLLAFLENYIIAIVPKQKVLKSCPIFSLRYEKLLFSMSLTYA
jgi:hypothetical protein